MLVHEWKASLFVGSRRSSGMASLAELKVALIDASCVRRRGYAQMPRLPVGQLSGGNPLSLATGRRLPLRPPSLFHELGTE